MGLRCSLVPAVLVNFNLPVSRGTVQCIKHCPLSQAVCRCIRPCKVWGTNNIIVTAFNLWQSTQKCSEPSFLCANMIGAAHTVVAGPMMLSACIWFISAAANCFVIGHAQYGVDCTVRTSSLRRSFWCLDLLITPRIPSHMLSNSRHIFKKADWWLLSFVDS